MVPPLVYRLKDCRSGLLNTHFSSCEVDEAHAGTSLHRFRVTFDYARGRRPLTVDTHMGQSRNEVSERQPGSLLGHPNPAVLSVVDRLASAERVPLLEIRRQHPEDTEDDPGLENLGHSADNLVAKTGRRTSEPPTTSQKGRRYSTWSPPKL
jgi:hypothetical protein